MEKKNSMRLKDIVTTSVVESDFVLLNDGMEFAYIKFDEKGNMKKKQMNF